MKRKNSKATLKQLVTAAHKAGAKVEVSLTPKVVTSTQPIWEMINDLKAIYIMANTRQLDAINCAFAMHERISSNRVLLILTQIRREI